MIKKQVRTIADDKINHSCKYYNINKYKYYNNGPAGKSTDKKGSFPTKRYIVVILPAV